MSAGTVRRPVLRYHGGKWRLAPWIIEHFPAHSSYVEPFGGAASVLLRKPRSHFEVYNDIDDDVVNLFRVLRDPVAGVELHRRLELTPSSRVEFKDSYLATDDPVERARRLVVRSFLGFGSTSANSATRTGFRGRGIRMRACAPLDWRRHSEALPDIIDRLRGVQIEHLDALQLIGKHDASDTLFYVDPPYPHSTRQLERDPLNGKHRYRCELSDDDHRAMAARLRAVSGMVVLSGYSCDLYDRELYPDWHRVQRAAWADGARKRTECLWLNQAAIAGLKAERERGNN